MTSRRTPEEWDELRYYREQACDYFPKLRRNSGVMVPHLLRCGLFGLGHARGQISQAFSVHSHTSIDVPVPGQAIHYCGPRLRQVHKRVVLCLTSRASQKGGGITLEFHAGDFLRSMGKDASSKSVNLLKEILTDLRAATFRVQLFERDKGDIFGFITGAEWDQRDFSVTMDRRYTYALELLSSTFVPLDLRNELNDNLESGLADLIWSTDVDLFQVDALAKMWDEEPGQFGRELTPALKKLREVGVIVNFQRMRGQFRIERGRRFARA